MTNIEEIVPEQFEIVANWLSRPDINRWLAGEWRGRLVTSVIVAMVVRNKKNRFFLVRYNGQPCGLTALADIDTADATAMVWYFLGEPAMSGRGIMSDAVRQMARKTFKEFRFASLYAWAMEDNIASVNVLHKVGFHEVGRIRRAASSNGRQVDRIYFDLLAGECNAI
jgi:RimJ/RimL family protein N-acetyltransferase